MCAPVIMSRTRRDRDRDHQYNEPIGRAGTPLEPRSASAMDHRSEEEASFGGRYGAIDGKC